MRNEGRKKKKENENEKEKEKEKEERGLVIHNSIQWKVLPPFPVSSSLQKCSSSKDLRVPLPLPGHVPYNSYFLARHYSAIACHS